ncbi:ring-1,2-phenylacetyl-CoA epoxidase subunit PaaD [Murinocardiopsis flavida]|uniref:Ring-1,2-phenylacetyl-CoA epoxidase subunit PaaD n=1 Tax=Murinocardiopsis flavida TaxID=645275 RepID=A0A2P8DMV4_9ACTN|nr:ring-1,2-phenylacetyl-CoA epoxidase subunit PaaD [Murinocardiopsis flavida]
MSARDTAADGRAERLAKGVADPELPMLTLGDLGIVRGVGRTSGGAVEVVVTPTYSGCPAMDAIRADIRGALAAGGIPDAEVRTVLSPPWTTDWISADGRRKLAENGIAPPGPATARTGPVPVALSVRCPQCGSPDTRLLSRFGSTACKALYVCGACREPFDHMKAL